MPLPLPTGWTDSTPAAAVHAGAHDDIADALNAVADGPHPWARLVPFGLRVLGSKTKVTTTPFTVAQGDTNKVVYTCPAGKMAWPLGEGGGSGAGDSTWMSYGVSGMVLYGATVGLVGVAVSGLDCGDVSVQAAPPVFSNVGVQIPVVLNAGETLELSSAAGTGGAVSAGILRMLELDPTESGLVSVHGVLPTVETVQYTVPTGRIAQFVYYQPYALGRAVAATPATHVHGRQIPVGHTSADAFTNIDAGGFFEGSGAGGSNGPNTTTLNPFDNILGPGDSISAWADSTGLAVTFSLLVQEVANT